MYKSVNPLFLISQTPMHAGSGDSLGIVDMPIQRERHTSFPKIEGSSFKGAVREGVEQNAVLSITEGENALENLAMVNKIFGYDDSPLHKKISTDHLEGKFTYKAKGDIKEKKYTDFAGAFGFTDARLLLFPVKSMRGIFAWITCPKVLYQFEEDMKLAKLELPFEISALEKKVEDNKALVASTSKLVISNSKKIVLEEYAFETKEEQDVNDLGEWLNRTVFGKAEKFIKSKILTDIVILNDDDFKDFVNLSTEVITRTKIDNSTGTVQGGALFTEEYLPSESVMYSLVLSADEFTKNEKGGETQEKLITFFDKYLPNPMQIGGNATIGKGITKTYFMMKGGTNNG